MDTSKAPLRKPRKRRARKRPKQFSSVEHLSLEAIAAFVDNELAASAAHRARVHVVQCPECRSEIHAQRGTSELLRGSNLSAQVRAPQELLARLKNMAQANIGPGPDADSTPTCQPEDFGDRVELLIRTLRRMHGHVPGRPGLGRRSTPPSHD